MKFSGSSGSRIIGHCEREKDKSGEYLKYQTNSNIDITRTHLNVSLVPDDEDAHERFNKRKEEIGIKRKDQVTMVDWVITLPQELLALDYDDQIKFFKSCRDFIADRYGKENLIGCFMHFDETTPHAHIPFTPVKDNKFQAKNILNRKDLNTFHEDLVVHLQNDKSLSFIGIRKEFILNGVTKTNKKTDELKAEKSKELEGLWEEKNALEKAIEPQKAEFEAFKEFKAVEKTINADLSIELPKPSGGYTGTKRIFKPDEWDYIKDMFSRLKTTILSLKEKIKSLTQEIGNLNAKNSDLIKTNKHYDELLRTVSEERDSYKTKYEKLKNTAWVKEKDDLDNDNIELKSRNEFLEKNMKNYQEAGYWEAVEKYAPQVDELKKENTDLKEQKTRLLKSLGKALNTNDEAEIIDFHQKVNKLGQYKQQRERSRGFER